MTALIITAYNRPQYLRKCLSSIGSSFLHKDAWIILVDDCSDDYRVAQLYEDFKESVNSQRRVQIIKHTERRTIKGAIKSGVNFALSVGCDLFINLDSDAVVKPNFYDRLRDLKDRNPNKIISGFNHVSQQNPNVFEFEDHYLKHYCNGINMCFNKEEYEKYILPGLNTHGNWDYNASVLAKKDSSMIVVTKPSVVQHIGHRSSMGHESGFDYAQDYKQIKLPDVTLFGIDASDKEGIERAARISQKDIEFGAVKIITERLFPGATRDEGRMNYSKFMIKNLTEHFDTSHVLTIHSDGYVVNWEAWDSDWLQYDYIGAPWDWHNEHMVGNGGFSLRSKKLCDLLARDNRISEFHPEDEMICRKYREYLERAYDIKFAPVEVAKKFSMEGWGLKLQYQVYGGQFGFHSYNLNFENSDVPKVFWPIKPKIEETAQSVPGRFVPNSQDVIPDISNQFPYFLPERFWPHQYLKDAHLLKRKKNE